MSQPLPNRESSLPLIGSGKTLLLLALLGEADLLAGQLVCPRSAPDAMTTFNANPTEEDWIVRNVSAYVPQSAWLVSGLALQLAVERLSELTDTLMNHLRRQRNASMCV